MELLTEIEELNMELQGLLPMNDAQQKLLHNKVRLEFNYNSNHIEGNTLTYGETKLLLIFGEARGNHTHQENLEMQASDVALELMEDLAKDEEKDLTESFIKELNRIILVKPYWKEAITADGQNTRRKILIGDYKKHPNSVRLQNGEIFDYATPIETPALMGDLIAWLRKEQEKKELHPLELATELHYRFVRIHPFDDGNGRISRLLVNYILLKNNYPPIIIKSDDKKNYLNALHDADTGNFESFKSYMAEQLVWSLDLYIKAAKGESLDEEEDWKKRLSLVKKELSEKDTLKLIKSNTVLKDLINENIFKTFYQIVLSLDDFNDLFLNRLLYLKTSIDIFSSKVVDSSMQVPINYIPLFGNVLNLEVRFMKFTKNIDDPFSLIYPINFYFEETAYRIEFSGTNNGIKKMYHQNFSEEEIKEIKKYIGSFVVTEIQKRRKP